MQNLKGLLMLFCVGLLMCACSSRAPIQTVPDGAIHTYAKVFRTSPPDNNFFNTGVFWFQVATMSKTQLKDSSHIRIDYIRIFEKTSRGQKMIYAYEGNQSFPASDIGLFPRTPSWFASDDHKKRPWNYVDAGEFWIDVGSSPDKIVHWWLPRFDRISGAKYTAEISFKLIGDISFQAGSDWWHGHGSTHTGWSVDCTITSQGRQANNCESSVGDWISGTGQKKVTIGL